MKTPKKKASKPSRAKLAVAIKEKETLVLQNYIQDELRKVVESAPGTASVIVTVTDFHAVTDTHIPYPLTDCKLAMESKNSRVKVVKNGLKISQGGPIGIHYKITGKEADDIYYPIGISFCPTETTKKGKHPSASVGTAAATLARKNFSQDDVHIYGTSLFFTDSCCVAAEQQGYRFCLIVQSVKNAEVGVIDPAITNNPPPPKLAH